MAYTKLDRVRPSPAGVWDSARPYTALELVNSPDGWKAYLARKAVPAGTALTDTTYWTEVLDVSDIIVAAQSATADANAAAAFAEPIRTKADGIKCTIEGASVAATDASDDYLRGLRVFGKTTQDGTPSPDAPVPLVSAGAVGSMGVTVAGKNLLNTDGMLSGALVKNGDEYTITKNGASRFSDIANVFIPKNKKFVVYADIVETTADYTAGLAVQFIYEDGTTESVPNNTGAKVKTKNIIGFKFFLLSDETDGAYTRFKNPRAELAEVLTEYEPYKEPQTLTFSTPNGLPGIPVSSGGNYTDADGQQWICDEIDLERGVYVQRIDTFTSTQAADWGFASISSNDLYRLYTNLLHDKALCVSADEPMALANIAKQSSANRTWLAEPGIGFNSMGSLLWYDENIQTMDALDAVLTETPLVVLYVLKTPVETALSATEIAAYRTLHSNYPNTTVYNDAGAHMAVSYNADTKTYIDNKFAALSAAIV